MFSKHGRSMMVSFRCSNTTCNYWAGYQDEEEESKKQRIAKGWEKSSDNIFVCERVCTSKRMLNKLSALSKDTIVDMCVTVCGVFRLDTCTNACIRIVCVNQHQVLNWNDICLKKCQSECLRLSNSSVISS